MAPVFRVFQRHFAVFSLPAAHDESLKTIVNGILEVTSHCMGHFVNPHTAVQAFDEAAHHSLWSLILCVLI